MLIFAFLSLFTVFSTSSISGAEPADEYEQTCTLNLPGISASNGCAQLTGYPTSNFGPVEFMWARNTGSSIEAMTGWSTTQTLTYCPSQSGDYRICARVVGCGQIYESNDVHVQVDPCGSLTGLYIYSQSSDSPVIGPISNGQTIQSSSLPNAYYLSVQTSGAIESVILNVDGSVITENVVLYTFPGNAENGTNWTNGIGSHTVSATGLQGKE
ncbi:MAG: hypothetical protein O2867_05195 [Bacteroidetes bacterium]|nr:hypothetical protein [Bacteroidota bacterium]